MAWRHWFSPHPDTHKKAHLLSLEALAAYIFLFLALQFSFHLVNLVKPGVLGTTSHISKEEVIRLTNMERAKLGLSPVLENSALDQAATAKAANMFAENYWAHFSPSGKDPWGFMNNTGYRFTFAGENLAKNFDDNQAVVTAWMHSPSHKENMVNSKYRDIGVAVEDGVLNGQKTTLVVQMFGTTEILAAANSTPSVNVAGQAHLVSQTQVSQPLVAAANQNEQQVLINPYVVSKSFGLAIVAFVLILLLVDYVVLRRRGVFRLTSHHLAHMAILSVAGTTLLLSSPGAIL